MAHQSHRSCKQMKKCKMLWYPGRPMYSFETTGSFTFTTLQTFQKRSSILRFDQIYPIDGCVRTSAFSGPRTQNGPALSQSICLRASHINIMCAVCHIPEVVILSWTHQIFNYELRNEKFLDPEIRGSGLPSPEPRFIGRLVGKTTRFNTPPYPSASPGRYQLAIDRLHISGNENTTIWL